MYALHTRGTALLCLICGVCWFIGFCWLFSEYISTKEEEISLPQNISACTLKEVCGLEACCKDLMIMSRNASKTEIKKRYESMPSHLNTNYKYF